MNFSKKLDILMKKNNIKNLRQLANELKIPYTTLWDYYSNPVRLEKANLMYLKKIAQYLNCTIDYLVYDKLTKEKEILINGYDINTDNSDKKYETKLKKFLEKIEYNDIENLVKNDKNKTILSLIDFYDLILMLYPNKYDLIEKENSFFKEHLDYIEKKVKEIERVKINNPNLKINFDIDFEDLNDDIYLAKKNQLYYCIKKYYSKKDILKGINNMNVFQIHNIDEENIEEEQRLEILENIIEKILNNLNT